MSDYTVIKALIRDMEDAYKVLGGVQDKIAAAIQHEVMARTPYIVACDTGYDGCEFIVRVFNVMDEQTEGIIEQLLHEMGVDAMTAVWTFSPYETKHYHPEYYKETSI